MKKTWILAVALLVAAATASASAADQKANREKHCVKCHGADGKGDTKMGKKAGVKDYSDAKVQGEMADDKMFKAIKEGVKENERTRMKGYAADLSDDEIKALVAHIRTLKK